MSRSLVSLASIVAVTLGLVGAARAQDAMPPGAVSEAPPKKDESPKPVVAPTSAPPPVEQAPVEAPSKPVITPGLEVFVEYDLRFLRGPQSWYHEFQIPRAHAWIAGEYGSARAKVNVEAVRSSSEGALLGVDGDSLVMRLREASIGYHVPLFAFDAGVIPTLTIPRLDEAFGLRAVAATPLELTGLGSPADLGASARLNIPGERGFVAVAAYNGEGYHQRELNRGKNLEAAMELHLAPGTAVAPLGIFASFVNGSTGTALTRADRLTAGLVWRGERVSGGADMTYAWGVADDAAKRSILADAFVRAEPIQKFILGVRGFYWQRDTATSADRVWGVTGAVGYRIEKPLETFLAVSRVLTEGAAATALPGLDRWDLRVIGKLAF